MPTNESNETTERLINAPAERIFAVLADPSQHCVIDGSGTVKTHALRARPAVARSQVRHGDASLVPYPIMNTVVEFEEGRRIAWQHIAHDVWRYELEPRDGGTLCARPSTGRTVAAGKLLESMGTPKQNLASMEKTLERLAAHVESRLTLTEASAPRRSQEAGSYTSARRADRVAEGARLLSE